MKKILYGIILLYILIFTNCSPRITSRITTAYEPLPIDAPIQVFNRQTPIPSKAEILGEVKSKDTGFSTNCDSVTIINKIKDEARKAGGNAIVILKHSKPSMWGSSCHQMEATILNVTDLDSMSTEGTANLRNAITDNTETTKKQRLLPRFSLSLGGGYGWRTAKLADGFSAEEKAFLKKLKNGPVWGASANYYFNDNYGLGLTYSAYSSKHSIGATDTESSQYGELENKDMITFIGPSFLMRYSSNMKWIFNINIGLGYIGYSSKSSFLNNESKISGASVGLLYELGVEYKFAKNWGIGADFTAISGTLGSFNINENGIKNTKKLSKDEREGLGHIRLSMGIKYYFK